MVTMLTVKDIENICQEFSNKVGDTFDLPVVINGRLTRTLGRVCTLVNTKTGYVTLSQMEISKQLLETATEESIRSVIGHEWAHYYVAKTTHERHGHDALFKATCARIGIENDKATTEVDRVVEVRSKYEVHCDVCNEVVGNYSRWCKTLSVIDRCTCNRCNQSKLRIVQNW